MGYYVLTIMNVNDHLVTITNYLQKLHPELSRERAFLEALIAYRRYGMRAEDCQ